MDSELTRRKPAKGPHGKSLERSYDGELLRKIVQRISSQRVKAFSGPPCGCAPPCAGAGACMDELARIPSEPRWPQRGSADPVDVGIWPIQSRCPSGTRLGFLDTPAGIPLEQPLQKVGRRVGALLGIGGAGSARRVILSAWRCVQAQLRVRLHLRGTTFTSTWARRPG